MNITKTVKTSTFRENLKFYRKKRGLTLEKLSKLTGLSVRMLSYYELYATNIPIDKLELIANSLGTPINNLVGITKKETLPDIDKEMLMEIDTRTL